MTANFTRQYRPPAAIETAADDALSVRLVQDMADAVNNAFRYVQLFKVIGQPCIPWWYSHASTTEQRVIGVFAPRVIAHGHNKLTWGIGHVRTAGANSTTWRLYLARRSYAGPVAFDSAYLGSAYNLASFTTSSDTHAVPAVDRSLDVILGNGGKVWLVLTAQNGDASTRSALTGFDAWPCIV